MCQYDNPPTVALLYQSSGYAESLARTVRHIKEPYEVDVLCGSTLRDRLNYLRQGDVDLVAVDEGMVNGVLAAGAKFVSGIPYVLSIRGWGDYTNSHEQYGILHDATIRLRTEITLSQVSTVIFLSNKTREMFTDRYTVGSSAVIGRPLDIERYQGGTWKDRDEGFVVLTVTNLRYREKFDGVLTILDGLKPLFDEYEELRYRIAGSGNYLDALRSYVDAYPYSERVEILGYREDVEDVLASGDVFAYVSYLDAYPTVILEAQSAGLPIVGGDAVGVPEAVGDAGVICPAAPEGIRNAVERVLVDDDYRKELAEQSRKKMQTHNENCTRQHLKVWDNILAAENHGE